MVGRITSQMLLNSAHRNLQASMAGLAKLQEQAGSQKLISRPSDDPAGAAQSMKIRADQRALTQYDNNIDDGLAWLATADSSLSNATDIMQKVRDLTVQASNTGVMSAASREAIAIELDSLKSELLAVANTKYAGRTIFAGNSDSGVAFTDDLTFTGATGSSVDRRISSSATVRVDVDGSAVFGSGDTSAFALIDSISADLRAGTAVSTRITEVDTALSSILGEQSRVGSRYSQLEVTRELNMDKAGSLESQRANIEDVDLAQVILELKTQETAYQTALSVTARSLQPTLMSFLS